MRWKKLSSASTTSVPSLWCSLPSRARTCKLHTRPGCQYKTGGTQRVGKHPADNLMRVGVGYQMQVTHISVSKLYMDDVGNPYLIGCRRYKPFHQIFPLMVAVVGVCRMADFTRGKHQVMTTQKHVETVTAGHKPGTEQGTKHDPKLITANPGVFLADFPYVSYDYTLPFQFRHDVGFRLVESLTTTAKQTAGKRDLQAAPADQFLDYLAPDFFRMGMLKYSSARVIIKSRASVSKRKKANAFSNSLMRFFNCAFSSL